MPRYVSSAKVRKVYDISAETLRKWALKGAVDARAIQNTGGRRTWMYNLESIGTCLDGENSQLLSSTSQDNQKPTIIYCRVSSKKQLPDLERQQALLSDAFPDSEVITDIGSGLEFNKPGFARLVQLVCREQISRIVVSFKDRIMRFGFELFQQICKEHNVQILVFTDKFEQDDQESETTELQQDLLSIVSIFVSKHNGKKSYMFRKLRKEQSEQSDEDAYGKPKDDFIL